MASHVSDTERAIFWTKWRFAQCIRSNGSTENQKGTSWKKKVVFVALVSVFLIFCLRSKMSSKSGKQQVLKENIEKKSFDEQPKPRIHNKINVKDQKDRLLKEKFEGNKLGFEEENGAKDKAEQRNENDEKIPKDDWWAGAGAGVGQELDVQHGKNEKEVNGKDEENNQIPQPNIEPELNEKNVKPLKKKQKKKLQEKKEKKVNTEEIDKDKMKKNKNVAVDNQNKQDNKDRNEKTSGEKTGDTSEREESSTENSSHTKMSDKQKESESLNDNNRSDAEIKKKGKKKMKKITSNESQNEQENKDEIRKESDEKTSIESVAKEDIDSTDSPSDIQVSNLPKTD